MPPKKRPAGKAVPKAKQAKKSKEPEAVETEEEELQVVPAEAEKPVRTAVHGRPFAQLVSEALKSDERVVQLPRAAEALVDTMKVPVTSSLLVEAGAGSLLPPVLRFPGLVVAGAGTKLTLRHLYIEAQVPAAELEVRAGASIELVNCRLQGVGLKLCPGSSARLSGTRIAQAAGAGVAGADIEGLVMESCQVTECVGEGIHSTSAKRLQLSDCTLTGNDLSGLVVDGKPGEAEVKGCTISRNGQFGVWLDSSSRVIWSQSSLAENTLGDCGGRGSLEGWKPGVSFSRGDECMAWFEKKGAWIPGKVKSVSSTTLTVIAHVPKKVGLQPNLSLALKRKGDGSAPHRRVNSKTQETADDSKEVKLVLSPDAVRLPRSGKHTPPSWSKKAEHFQRRNSALELFLQEGGHGVTAWKTLDPKERARFQSRARKEQRAKTEKKVQSEVSEGSAAPAVSRRFRIERAMSKSGVLSSLSRKKRRR